jgi:hypothetical protein
MVSKKNVNGINVLYFLIFFLTVSLIIVSTLLYYAYNNSDITNNIKRNSIVFDKKVDSCPSCPPPCTCKAESAIPVYPKKLPSYDNNREYQQIGILTSNDSDSNEPIILPLFSKRANNHRDRWNYYTTTDKNTMLRLPISHDNMKCDDDIGCNEIYDGNTLYIEMYKGKTFTATIYKKQTLSYFADKY